MRPGRLSLVVVALLPCLQAATPPAPPPVEPQLWQVVPRKFQCGETVVVFGQFPDHTKVAETELVPASTGVYRLTVPCQGEDRPEYQLSLDGKALQLNRVRPADPPPPWWKTKTPILLLGALIIIGAGCYALFYFLLRPKIVEETIDTVRAELKTGRPVETQSLPADVVKSSTDFFRGGALQQFEFRLAKLEQVPAPAAPVPPPSTRGLKPGKKRKTEVAVASLKPDPYQEFIDFYNKTRNNPGLRDDFDRRYPCLSIALTNPIEVTRAGETPRFETREGGDLFVVSSADVDRESSNRDGVFYLAPTLDKRWTNDRITGGSWSYFFDIDASSGSTKLLYPANVRQQAGHWILVEEDGRGQLAWDPMA